ncbi:hypothetical protein [Frigidibacter sp. ROC022]|uniref:hypothetical protein n=1 Tax=Frigidibacter sp. ROC022 TaxID=2971796 RepID=UPI00215B2FA1|nr:hypothetical protein [Frigidibacter sp. ROC022]MCR8723855.1 hypothetical protein [Frigidibacter sp. ROC022]
MAPAIKTIGPWLAVMLLGFAALQSLVAFRSEFAAFRLGRQPPGLRIPALGRATVEPPASFRARRELLDSCDRGLRGPYGAFQPVELRQGLVQTCARAADSILRRSPTDSMAFLVAAEAALQAGDRPRFLGDLALSQRTAPAEGWLAQRRIDLIAPQIAASAEPGLQQIARADLRLLFLSPAYIPFLARLHDSHPALQPLITAVAETVRPAQQRRFLNALRALKG